MATNRITEGVGKKIVEALKQQSDIEINPVQEDDSYPTPVYEAPESDIISAQQNILAEDSEPSEEIATDQPASFTFANSQHINDTFNSTLMNFQQKENIQAVEDFELPPNVAVLKQLINKLPSGVSKQTGALIIKQTMEALGISMTGVLQEAQQVQESLNQSVRDCQTNILEYKKQISMLEAQAQKYQRQFAVVNDIISLFIQTNH
ncbi:TPA: hypothetical protein IAC10_09860 [Candidatus Scatousia excrementigallinarum]|uniref:Uncharacterized protein n=1 Tax=Candidatus Scatousia excrementigallinarum TaxID=2840935 RepID=A0A9D1F0E5_9BACT|nr:hypothetical protein [Candidatus Scatousia excrementigallinarum]